MQGHLGTPAHTHWLDAQLNRQTLRAGSGRFPASASSPSSAASPPHDVSGHSRSSIQSSTERKNDGGVRANDGTIGSLLHAAWLDRQVASHSARASPPAQPDVGLPPGVNAMLRGQDLSSHSHAEWLERQLPIPSSGELRRLDDVQLPAPSLHGSQPSSSPSQRPPPVEDTALGSQWHHEWLELQLRRQRTA